MQSVEKYKNIRSNFHYILQLGYPYFECYYLQKHILKFLCYLKSLNHWGNLSTQNATSCVTNADNKWICLYAKCSFFK